ncbi:MAG: hopanoid-associated sugar epimerase [Candidatus Acidiferrales bacterium]
MNALVTGASGFVGSHVARLLAGRGDRVRVLLRPTSDLRALRDLPVERVAGDLRDSASLAGAVSGVDTVFHVAADYRLWTRNPAEIYECNVTGTRNLLDAAQNAGVRRFIYTSSVATVAVHRPGALPDENVDSRLDEMIGHYKRSKFLAEQEALQAAQRGMRVVVVNPTTPIGPGDWKPTPTGRLIVDFLSGRMPAYVDTGLNIVPVEDAARGHLLAAERGQSGQRYILGGRNMTMREILEALARVTGRPAPRVRLPHAVALAAAYADTAWCRMLGREPRIPIDGVRMSRHRMFVDCSRATRELGFAAGAPEAALASAARWYEENGYVPGRAEARAQAAAA